MNAYLSRPRFVARVPQFSAKSLLVSLIAAAALTACQTPPVRDRVVTVSVPIATTPIKPADVPKMPAPLPKRPANVSSALDLALGKVCEWVAFGLRADPLLRVSSGQPPLEPPKFPECER